MRTLKIPQATKLGYIEVDIGGAFDASFPSSLTRRGRVQEGGAVSPTITCNPECINVYEGIKEMDRNFRIRKLTPKECFRLMDVNDADIEKIQAAGISESQQYKMAGNSIVVACMVGIFRNLFSTDKEERTTLF